MVDVSLFVVVVGMSARGAKKLCHMYYRAAIDDVLHLLRYRRGHPVDADVGETTCFARTMKDPPSTQHFFPNRVNGCRGHHNSDVSVLMQLLYFGQDHCYCRCCVALSSTVRGCVFIQVDDLAAAVC
jgi:hypothetical protein